MDLIQRLEDHLGLGRPQAEAVAGALLGAVFAQAPAEDASSLDAAIPELPRWRDATREATGGALRAPPMALFARLGLPPSSAAVAVPLLHGFLEERLGVTSTRRLVAAAPILGQLLPREPEG